MDCTIYHITCTFIYTNNQQDDFKLLEEYPETWNVCQTVFYLLENHINEVYVSELLSLAIDGRGIITLGDKLTAFMTNSVDENIKKLANLLSELKLKYDRNTLKYTQKASSLSLDECPDRSEEIKKFISDPSKYLKYYF